jgi:hypothetical protein
VLFVFEEQLDRDLGPLWRIGSDAQRLYIPSDQLPLALEGGEAWAEAAELLLQMKLSKAARLALSQIILSIDSIVMIG